MLSLFRRNLLFHEHYFFQTHCCLTKLNVTKNMYVTILLDNYRTVLSVTNQYYSYLCLTKLACLLNILMFVLNIFFLINSDIIILIIVLYYNVIPIVYSIFTVYANEQPGYIWHFIITMSPNKLKRPFLKNTLHNVNFFSDGFKVKELIKATVFLIFRFTDFYSHV